MSVRSSFIVVALSLMAGAPAAHGMLWSAQPIAVHEWGVEVFDWSGAAAATALQVPGYMYTDAHPGVPVAMPTTRAKDLPPDIGLRKKPILYFYPDFSSGFSQKPIPIGVEVRFAQGHATAWYPQVNVYRPEGVAAAGKAQEQTAVARPAGPFTVGHHGPLPDDTRMQLVWSSLTLTKDDPHVAPLPGADLPADHWTKTARAIPGAAYVSNGKEAGKYLFYEGGTHEQPAIAIESKYDFQISQGPMGQIVNVSDSTIYDVFAIYHSGAHTWVGYVSALEPMKSAADSGSGGVTARTLPIPDFSGPVAWTDPAALHDATTGRLLSALTEGGAMTVKANEYRNPAEPQGPTTSSQLFPDEAAALEKIWHHDFFDPSAPPSADGLTIIYRQSPAALDADMPMKLYTDMYHYFTLSRCGLVVVRNIDLKLAYEADEKVIEAGATGSQYGDKVRNDALAFLHQHPGMALGALGFVQKQNDSPQCQALREQLEAGR